MCKDKNALPNVVACDLVERSNHALAELLCWFTIGEGVPVTCCSCDADDVYMTLMDGFGKYLQVVPFLDNRDRLDLADTNLGKALHKSKFQAEVGEKWSSCLLAAT